MRLPRKNTSLEQHEIRHQPSSLPSVRTKQIATVKSPFPKLINYAVRDYEDI